MGENKTHNIMKLLRLMLSTAVLLAVSLSCEPQPRPIDYGSEACEYCRMGIVDDRYAAQLVSKTGKTFSFDAMECMIHFKEENTDHKWTHEMLTDYTKPGTLIPAEESTVIRSKELPSPMGMYLTAVGSKEQAEKLQGQYNGKLYSYPEVEKNIDNLPAL